MDDQPARRRPRLPGVVRPPRRDLGEEPDHRFTLANERTFLSWLRTSLALVAAGLAAVQLLPELVVPHAREVIAVVLVLLGTIVASASFRRWAQVEEAMRQRQPIPASWIPGFLAACIAVLSVAAVALLVATPD